MRMLTALVVVCLSLGTQPQAPVFKTTTQLVEFTLVALDSRGNPVTDLRKDEVVVREKGRPREVSFFRFEGAESVAPTSAAPPAGVFSNRLDLLPGPPRNVSAIVLDTLNTDPSQMMWVRAQVTRSLRALAPRTRVAVYHLGARLTVIHDFTDDVESLREKVAKSTLALPPHTSSNIDSMARDAEELLALFPNSPMLVELLRNQIEMEGLHNASVRQQRVGMTLSALEMLGQHLAGIPGRKNLVWIGGGISMLTITGAMGFGAHGGFESHENVLTTSARRLAQNGVALYVVDARGLRGPQATDAAIGPAVSVRGEPGHFETQQQAEDMSADPLPAANRLAGITGGRVIKNTNDPMEGLSRAERDVRGSYSVGFYASGEPDGKWHEINVRVKRPGVRLEYREGFLAERPAPEPVTWSVEEWRTAVQNPMGSTAIALEATCEGAKDGDQGVLVLTLRVDPATLHFRRVDGRLTAEVEFGIAEKTADGKIGLHTEGGSFVLAEGGGGGRSPDQLLYMRTWKPAAGIHTIRIVVRDKLTGRHGALDVPYTHVPGVRPGTTG